MAKLYVTEFTSPGRYYGGAQCAFAGGWAENASSPISYTGTAGFSATFAVNTTLIRVHTDSICSVLVGKATANGGGTVTTSNARMVAGQTEYYEVPSGYVISAIVNT